MKDTPWPAPPHDAPLPKPGDPPGPRKATLRRFTWSRLHADLPSMDIWGLVAEMAKSDRAKVEALVWRLETYASTTQPRGSLVAFPLRALAVTWRCEADELARIYAALEHPHVGWLEGDVIVTFWERNPDQEDPTGPERAKRSRARRKIIGAMQAKRAPPAEILDELARQGLDYPQVRTVTRDTVTVTPRAEQSRQQADEAAKISGAAPAAAPQAVQGETGESGENSIEPVLWLATEGKRILVERLNETPVKAEMRLERWQREIGGDLAALVTILDRAAASDLVVARFLVTVSEAITRHRLEAKGPLLPMPPSLASEQPKRRASGE